MALSQKASPSLGPSLRQEQYLEESKPPLASEESEEVFQDAAEEPNPPPPSSTTGLFMRRSPMDLHTAFEECEEAIQKFFNNDLTGALNIMKPWCRSSLYHSLGTSIFEFIPAMLTFDQSQIGRALRSLKACITICNQSRRTYTLVESIGTMMRKANYSDFTDMEAHAEICYAEALLLQAMMTIMEGEDLSGLIKGTIKVKTCYSSYKHCNKILEQKTWESEVSKVHFHSGVRLGIATFNLLISMLPSKIISLLEFVGFSGDKNLGLSELEAGSRSPGLRSVLCDLTLLAYHLVICHFTGGQGDMTVCDRILRKELEIYPKGVWFLLFKGRYQLLNGIYTPAIETYNNAIDSQDMWPQFRHVCYWEIMWIHALMTDWHNAAVFAGKLINESSWSRTIYSYTKAAMYLQLGNELTDAERQECINLFRNASYYKQRIAGKSLPMEKFMIRRCTRYHDQGGRLVLPGVELLCLWNMFHILATNTQACQHILKLIEKEITDIKSRPCGWMAGYEADNTALLLYLHGACLAAMRLPRLALESLQTIYKMRHDVKNDTFIVPYSIVEMAMCHHQLGDSNRAVQLLLEARKKYTGYALESRLLFRIHAKMQLIRGADNSEAHSSRQ